MTPEQFTGWVEQYGKGPGTVYPAKVKQRCIIPIGDGTAESTVRWFLTGVPWEPADRTYEIETVFPPIDVTYHGYIFLKPPINAGRDVRFTIRNYRDPDALQYLLNFEANKAEGLGYTLTTLQILAEVKPPAHRPSRFTIPVLDIAP